MCIDMRIDMCLDMCADMCIDMWIDMCIYICMDMCIDMCTDMCIDMCIDMGIDMRTDMYIDKCIDMCIDMCMDMCMDMCVDMCVDMCIYMCIGEQRCDRANGASKVYDADIECVLILMAVRQQHNPQSRRPTAVPWDVANSVEGVAGVRWVLRFLRAEQAGLRTILWRRPGAHFGQAVWLEWCVLPLDFFCVLAVPIANPKLPTVITMQAMNIQAMTPFPSPMPNCQRCVYAGCQVCWTISYPQVC